MDGIEIERRQGPRGRTSIIAVSLIIILIIVGTTIGVIVSRRDNVEPERWSLGVATEASDAPSLSPTINNNIPSFDPCGSSTHRCLPNTTSTVSFLIYPYNRASNPSNESTKQTWRNITLQYLFNNSDCDDVDIQYQRQSLLYLTNITNTTNEQVLLIEFEVNNTTCLPDPILWDPTNATDPILTGIMQHFQNISNYFALIHNDKDEFQEDDPILTFYFQQDLSDLVNNTITPTPTLSPTVAPVQISRWGSFEELEMVPHDAEAFTQGLEIVPGNPDEYFESTGTYGGSSIRRVDLYTGQVLQKHDLSSDYFGEGLTYYLDKDGNERLIQLTWREGVLFRYDAQTFEVLEERPMDSTTNGQGWGICFVPNEDIFYVSDGTHYLHKWNASTLKLMDRIPVTYRDTMEDLVAKEQDKLNELEYDVHSNTIFANVWRQNYIVRINPATGFITHRYDLTALDRHDNTDVLNGIAITDIPNEIWVTGKYWPVMYRIRLID